MHNILLNSKLCIGPMSKNIVDSIIEFSNKYKINFTLIPSRRQIEWNGGYVNNWNTKDFSEYVKSKSKYIAIQRDHGGPGQGKEDDDGYESLKYDCKYFDSIHIDPWKKYSNFEEGVEWSINMIKFCYKINPELYYEVGTEEAIRPFTLEELELLITKLKDNLEPNIYDRILFCVIQSGTRLLKTRNTGKFNLEKMKNMIKILDKYGKFSKEHNGDYLSKEDFEIRFKNSLKSINIAPEFGVHETKTILDLIGDREDKINLFYKMCFESNKWKKWVDKDFEPEKNKLELVKISGHYVFSYPDFNEIIKDIDIDLIKNSLTNKLETLQDYLNFYHKKHWLKNVIRIHPPKETQQINNNRLRQHRAERLYPFPHEFFNNFIKSINQEDFRYYPYTTELKEKLSKINGIPVENIFLNNGSSENIRIFYEAFATNNGKVIITEPCYPMHQLYAEIQGSNLVKIPYRKNISLDTDIFLEKITDKIDCICFANPNSPIGDIIPIEIITQILTKAQKFNIPVLIDEAYIEYSPQKSCVDLLDIYDNLIISRTFSKGLGCAGLRIGYLLGNYNLMGIINKLIPTYEVSNISARFGLYLLNNKYIVDDYLNLIYNEKNKLKQIFQKEDIKYYIGEINTIFIKPNNISSIINHMNQEKILFRTRKLPHDLEDWLALVLYPNFSEGELMKNIVKLHQKTDDVWKKIFLKIPWLEKQKLVNKKLDIEDLLQISGHVSDTGSYNVLSIKNVVKEIKEELQIKEKESILELGCGPGTILSLFDKNELYGVDYSNEMIHFAKTFFNNDNFFVGEINNLNFIKDNSMDVIISHSCIQYIPSINYLKEVINESYRCLKTGGRLSFTDVNNKEYEKDYIKYRIKTIGRDKYIEKYSCLKHFYISKKMFTDLLRGFSNVNIKDSVKRGTEDKNYRFNIYCVKK